MNVRPRRGALSHRTRVAGVLSVALLAAVTACRPLPPLDPLDTAAQAELRARCSALFPRGSWEATHVVDASLPLGKETSLLGVISARGGDFRSVLMSQEGFVLLDASYRRGRVVTHRAVPPLDRRGFDEGMVGDIRLALFPPEGELLGAGRDRDGVPTCRWRAGHGVVEAGLLGRDEVRLRRFDERRRPIREARLKHLDECGFARTVELEARGLAGYQLTLSLVERSASGCKDVSATSR